jgi:hypothetical protein
MATEDKSLWSLFAWKVIWEGVAQPHETVGTTYCCCISMYRKHGRSNHEVRLRYAPQGD